MLLIKLEVENINFKIDQATCIQCKACISECPVLIINGKTNFPEIKEGKEKNCIKCQHCLAVCPTASLSIWGKNPKDSVLTKEAIPKGSEMSQLIKTRRSTRKFKAEPLDKSLIQELLQTAAYAPTAQNKNAVMYSVADDTKQLSKLRDLTYERIKAANDERRIPEKLAFINNFQKMWFEKGIDILFRGAPHFLIASAPKNVTNPLGDGYIALSYFELLANTHGIGTLWNGFAKWVFNDIAPELRESIGIPEDHVLAEIMLFGKPAVNYARSIQSDGLHFNPISLL